MCGVATLFHQRQGCREPLGVEHEGEAQERLDFLLRPRRLVPTSRLSLVPRHVSASPPVSFCLLMNLALAARLPPHLHNTLLQSAAGSWLIDSLCDHPQVQAQFGAASCRDVWLGHGPMLYVYRADVSRHFGHGDLLTFWLLSPLSLQIPEVTNPSSAPNSDQSQGPR